MQFMEDDKININIKTLVIIIVGIVIVIAIIIFFLNKPKAYKNEVSLNEINQYKRAVYLSFECQFNCPVVNLTFNNETRLLPIESCIKSCTKDIKEKKASGLNYSENELLNDDLFKDIDLLLSKCKNENKYNVNNSSLLNYSNYFPCVVKELSILPEKYSYLK